MEKASENLRIIAEHFQIKNKSIASALNVHSSQVSRWMSGERVLRLDSEYIEPLIDYILSRELSSKDILWIKRKFEEDGIKAEFSSVSDIKLGLMLWLAADSSDVIRGILSGASEKSNSISLEKIKGAFNPERIYGSNYSAKVGITEISLCLGSMLTSLDPGSIVDICISGDNALAVSSETFFSTIQNAIATFKVRFRVLLSLSSKKQAPPKTLTTYLDEIVKQGVEVFIIHADAGSITEQTTIIIPGRCAMIITELPDSLAPVAAILVYERTFLRDIERNFTNAIVYAQPLFTSFTESSNRKLQNIYYSGYCDPGDLFIIRDGISPLYMSCQSYDAFLKARGHEGDAFKWRSEEFRRIKTEMEENLKKGMHIKEIMTLSSWNKIADEKYCTIPGELLLETGMIVIDKKMCRDILEGYVHYMKLYPNVTLRFSDKLGHFHEKSEWHIKESRHVLINKTDGSIQPYLFSSQQVFLYAIKNYFETEWQKLGYYSVGNTHALIMINYEIAQMEKQLKNNE